SASPPAPTPCARPPPSPLNFPPAPPTTAIYTLSLHDALPISSAATDDKAKYIEAMRSGRTKYRKMTPNSDVTTRTYGCLAIITGDRKSTRLNSSHVSISYAVFCLKKKKTPLDPPSNTVSSAQD